MREKKWVDCPICGSKNSMKARRGITEHFEIAGYPAPGKLIGLSGQFCSVCGDGFWSLASERKIARYLAHHMAEHDSKRIVAADLASVRETATRLRVTAQGVHKMMETGRLRSVFVAGKRLPIRADVLKKAKQRGRATA
ncbi:MAG: hypothetical protein FJY92_00860 [Candidatus Hydrogenedentes bacterium]|nr:hypothetical protein [Candidatus Hydrogenedentota bacterium]